MNKVNLYGVNLGCKCECSPELHIFKDGFEAVEFFKECIKKDRKVRNMSEFLDCEDLEDGRYIYRDRILELGFNWIDIDGRIVRLSDKE